MKSRASGCACCSQLLDMMEYAVIKSTPIQLAFWRVETRRRLGMPERFEPLLDKTAKTAKASMTPKEVLDLLSVN